MSLPWMSGQRCLVVQCDKVTGKPVPGGRVIGATAAHFHMNADIDVVLDPGAAEGWVATRFGGSDAWNAYGPERTWRLMTPEDFAEKPEEPDRDYDPEHRHGYWEAGDY